MISATEQVKSFMLNCNTSLTGGVSVAREAIEEFVTYYDKESFEIQLLEMENALINNSENKVEVVQGVFRDMHSLKGSSAMLKIDPMTHLLHNLEDVLGIISRNALNISAVKKTDLFDFFLQAFDLTEKLINTFQQDPHFVLKNSKKLFGFYIRIINNARYIVHNIDQYMEFTETDESLF